MKKRSFSFNLYINKVLLFFLINHLVSDRRQMAAAQQCVCLCLLIEPSFMLRSAGLPRCFIRPNASQSAPAPRLEQLSCSRRTQRKCAVGCYLEQKGFISFSYRWHISVCFVDTLWSLFYFFIFYFHQTTFFNHINPEI